MTSVAKSSMLFTVFQWGAFPAAPVMRRPKPPGSRYRSFSLSTTVFGLPYITTPSRSSDPIAARPR
jgi:hypothetical protein